MGHVDPEHPVAEVPQPAEPVTPVVPERRSPRPSRILATPPHPRSRPKCRRRRSRRPPPYPSRRRRQLATARRRLTDARNPPLFGRKPCAQSRRRPRRRGGAEAGDPRRGISISSASGIVSARRRAESTGTTTSRVPIITVVGAAIDPSRASSAGRSRIRLRCSTVNARSAVRRPNAWPTARRWSSERPSPRAIRPRVGRVRSASAGAPTTTRLPRSPSDRHREQPIERGTATRCSRRARRARGRRPGRDDRRPAWHAIAPPKLWPTIVARVDPKQRQAPRSRPRRCRRGPAAARRRPTRAGRSRSGAPRLAEGGDDPIPVTRGAGLTVEQQDRAR